MGKHSALANQLDSSYITRLFETKEKMDKVSFEANLTCKFVIFNRQHIFHIGFYYPFCDIKDICLGGYAWFDNDSINRVANFLIIYCFFNRVFRNLISLDFITQTR